MIVVLGGFALGLNGNRVQLPLLHNPSVEEVEKYVLYFENKAGCLVINHEHEDGSERPELTLQCEGGNYVLTLLLAREIGSDVRSYWAEGRRGLVIDVLGEPYPAGMVTQSIEVVKTAFFEFLATGDVSVDLMN